MSYDEVVFKRSYINLILLNRAIPGFKPFDEEEEEEEALGIPPTVDGVKTSKNKSMYAGNFFMNFM